MASIADTPFTFIGLDVHKDSISAGILEHGATDPTHDKVFHDEPRSAGCWAGSIRRSSGSVRRRGRPATAWPGCSLRWVSTARSSPRC